jgi:hypothetical protein
VPGVPKELRYCLGLVPDTVGCGCAHHLGAVMARAVFFLLSVLAVWAALFYPGQRNFKRAFMTLLRAFICTVIAAVIVFGTVYLF